MKKLFEKPIFHYTFVLTVVAIVCGFAIGGVNAITEPIIENNINQAKEEAYSRVLPGFDIDNSDEFGNDGDPESIVSRVIGRNSEGQIIGYIYQAYATNKFGYMRVVVSVSASGTILAADFIEINQSLNVAGTRTNLSLYVGTSITGLEPSGDLVSGATYSLDTLQSMLIDIATAHEHTVIAPDQPYELWFGISYSMEIDNAFVPTDEVLSRFIVKDSGNQVIGSFYHLSGSGVYNGPEGSIGTIHVYVGLDTEGTILGIDIPKEEFGHNTTSQFLGKNVTYVNSMIGNNISSYGGNQDLAAGASNSRTLIDSLLDALGGEWS